MKNVRAFFLLLALVDMASSGAPLRAQYDSTRLREARLYAQTFFADTAGKGFRTYHFSLDDPRLPASQGRTTSYTYLTDALGHLAFIQTSQAAHQRIQQSTYYLRDGALLYATEEEILNLKSGEDHGRILWSGEYAFRDGRLADFTSNGHGISETDDWKPEVMVPAAFRKAHARVLAYKKRGQSARRSSPH